VIPQLQTITRTTAASVYQTETGIVKLTNDGSHAEVVRRLRELLPTAAVAPAAPRKRTGSASQ
jgi:hypothetical protein